MPPPLTTAELPYSSHITGSVVGRIRKLTGFQKSHHVPDGHHAAAQAFVRRIGHDTVKAAADNLYADLRTVFGYKRKEFTYSSEAGAARLKTPDFDVHIQIDQCPEDAKNYRLTTEVVEVFSSEIAGDSRFHACFTPHCNRIVIEFPTAINIDEKIDRIESLPELEDFLTYAPDGSSFELKVPALDLHLRATESEIVFQLLAMRDLAKLLKHSQKALDLLIGDAAPSSSAP